MPATWKKIADMEGGGMSLELEPAPVLREPITLDVFERALLLLGMDADAVLGGHVQMDAVDRPPLDVAQMFLDVVLSNSDEYDLRDMQPAYAKAMLEHVTIHFIMASLAR